MLNSTEKKLKTSLTMFTMTVLLLLASTVIAANPVLQPAYADTIDFKKIKSNNNGGNRL
jgi:hypothetical protein